MKKLLIPIIMCITVATGLIAQNQTAQPEKSQVIVKKIIIENVDGKETRTETVDTFDAANWNEESLENQYQIYIQDPENSIEFVPQGAGSSKMIEEELAQVHSMVASPNKAVMGVQLSNVHGDNGAQVDQIFEGSAAEKAGIKEGDILLSVDGKETNNVEEVIAALENNKPGDKVKVKFLRGTKVKDLRLTLQERKEESLMMKECTMGGVKMKCCKTGEGKMKCCKPGELKKCMPLDGNLKKQIEKEIKIMGTPDGNQKTIIIKKQPGEVRIQRNGGSGSNREIEIIQGDRSSQKTQEVIVNKNFNQSLNVEYLTSSPNPSNGQMKINFSGLSVPTTIKVIDLNGKEVYNEKIENFDGVYNKEIDIKNEAKGTLILKITQGEKIMTQKIIVE